MKKALILVLLLIASGVSAQYGYRDSNMIGLFGGVNQTSLSGSSIKTKAETGWNVGLSIRGNFYNDFDMVYSIQFTENAFSARTLGSFAQVQEVKLKVQGVKISLQPSYKLIEDHLSFELGPVLMVNGKMTYDEIYKDNIVTGTTTVSKLEEVPTFSILGAAGITAGIRNLRLNVQYMYGFNNFLSKVPADPAEGSFKGHLGIVTGNIIIYF